MGGAAGHMNHPFDLEWVNSGSDLLDFFNKAKAFIEEKRGGSVKIDGVNVSFKVVETSKGHEFAVDRGSMKEIDISGITVARFEERFPPGHGMRRFVAQLLTILNAAIGDVEPELKALGMWNDPSMFLNTEYVEGTTNVTQYDENFLAIHGLNQFYERIAKSGASKGNVRAGAERPEIWDEKKQKEVPIKDPSREVSYDPAVMASLIEKLKPYGESYGFQIYGDVPTEQMADVDYTGALSDPLAIKISDDRTITKSLGEWLQGAANPRYKPIKVRIQDSNGERMMSWHPLHKDLYKALSSGEHSVINMVDEQDAENAINGTVFMHATRMLGNQILKALTSPMGDVINHEGVVLRDQETFGTQKPVKITGEFIVGGTASSFQKKAPVIMKEMLDIEIEDEDEDPVVDADFIEEPKTIAIVPGAFKPPHAGHADMVRRYATGTGVPKADEVLVVISAPQNANRTLEDGTIINEDHAIDMWQDIFPDVVNLPGVKLTVAPSHMRSPITMAYEYIGDKSPIPFNIGDRVILGASRKDDDWKRWVAARKYVQKDPMTGEPRIELLAGEEYAVPALVKSDGSDFSATTMRELISNLVADSYDRESYDKLSEFIPGNKIDVLFSILDLPAPKIEPIEELDEMSAMGGGAVAIGQGPFPGKRNRKPKKKKQKKENIDLSLVDDVIRLIMERGISQ
jgi:hypothetical protein